LTLVEPIGPFLTLPVLRRVWPGGLDRTPPTARAELRERFDELGQEDQARREFVSWVLTRLLSFGPAVRVGQGVPETLTVALAEQGVTLRPDFAVVSGADGATRLLVSLWPAGSDLGAHVAGEHWAASPVDRMTTHLRHVGVELGLVTDGDRFCLVWAPRSGPVGRATWVATVFSESAEQTLLDSFTSVLGAKRFFAVAPEDQVEALLAEAASAQAEVTGQLGYQVRRAVELLVAAFSRANREHGGTLLAGLDPHFVYEAACTVMMRLVFLLYAEERRLLPLGEELYDRSYAVSTLRQMLRDTADAIGNDETLEHTCTAWPRLLATFRAVHAGIAHDELRLPAYGGRLFDPDRYPFLEGRMAGESWHSHTATPIPVDDRTVLGALSALQVLQLREGGVTEARRLSFRSLDVEQIGHVYEGLLDHGARRIEQVDLGLVGKPGEEAEIALADLEEQAAQGDEHLVAWLGERTKRTENQVRTALAKPLDDARRRSLRAACDNDDALLDRTQRYAWLLRDDVRDLPMVLLPGSIYVTEVSHRRDTGTEYTTKELADEVVRYALEPLVYSPGPAEGVPSDQWKLRRAGEILALQVCDPAVGSGAIITAACRYIADRLVEAWAAEDITPSVIGASPFDDVDDILVAARREVAERCLFGVDRDPMAVEMAKLSLWLVTMAKERPFSFLDHAFRAGDSLLGITSLDQVARFHIHPHQAHAPFNLAGDLEPLVKEALELRRKLEAAPVITLRDAEEKERLFGEASRAVRTVEIIADLVVGAALSTAGQSKRDLDTRLASVASQVRSALDAGDDTTREQAFEHLAAQADAWLNERRPEGAPHRRALHWPLAFPEAFIGRASPGFDAMVGNPPYLHGQKITGTQGVDLREYVVAQLADGRRGSADLVAYFFLLATGLTNYLGFLATNSISQGDSRDVALEPLLADGWTVYRAVKSVKWPGSASLEIAKVWMTRLPWRGPSMLDGRLVEEITPLLAERSRVAGRPYRLAENADGAYQGSNVLGTGFIVTPDEAAALLEVPANAEVIKPYLNGEDLTSSPTCEATRWIINFYDWGETRARAYSGPFAVVEKRVKPDRLLVSYSARAKQFWWQYERPRVELYQRIALAERVLVIANVSKTAQPGRVPGGQVFDKQLTVFIDGSDFCFGVLTSAFHWWWTLEHGSTHETRLRYTVTDVFETFPQPPRSDEVAQVGTRLDGFRAALMADNQEGLTKTYNRVHGESDQEPDIYRLRKLHRELDEAVAVAYLWGDLDLDHGFHETPQGVRWTIGPAARIEVLDRLLELNHERHAAEVAPGPPAKAKKAPRKRKAESAERADTADATLFDTLFSGDQT